MGARDQVYSHKRTRPAASSSLGSYFTAVATVEALCASAGSGLSLSSLKSLVLVGAVGLPMRERHPLRARARMQKPPRAAASAMRGGQSEEPGHGPTRRPERLPSLEHSFGMHAPKRDTTNLARNVLAFSEISDTPRNLPKVHSRPHCTHHRVRVTPPLYCSLRLRLLVG